MAETKAFVCGHPIAHSRSPMIHGYWLSRYDIDGSYERVDVVPADFAAFLQGLEEAGFAGGNITLPHKEAAFELAHKRDQAAEMIGAVNTLWFEDGELWGGNTDAYGYAAHLDAKALGWRDGTKAIVLGAGGAARAVVYALQEAGYKDICIVNRTRERAVELAQRFGAGASGYDWASFRELADRETDLLVNTSVLGMTGKPPLEIDLSSLPGHAIVSDIVYAPLHTALLVQAEERGLSAVDGLGMLLHQAVPGFERWFGVRPEVTDELWHRIIADLERPA